MNEQKNEIRDMVGTAIIAGRISCEQGLCFSRNRDGIHHHLRLMYSIQRIFID